MEPVYITPETRYPAVIFAAETDYPNLPPLTASSDVIVDEITFARSSPFTSSFPLFSRSSALLKLLPRLSKIDRFYLQLPADDLKVGRV